MLIGKVINNEKGGMELVSYIGLCAFAITLGSIIWASTSESLKGQLTAIAEILQLMFG